MKVELLSYQKVSDQVLSECMSKSQILKIIPFSAPTDKKQFLPYSFRLGRKPYFTLSVTQSVLLHSVLVIK